MEQLTAAQQAAELNKKNLFATYNHIEAEFVEPDHAIFKLEIRPESKNPYGIVHGGAIYTMADNATGYAAHTDGRSYVTQGSSMHFLRNQSEGVVRADAKVRHRGRTTCLVNVDILGEGGISASIPITWHRRPRSTAEEGLTMACALLYNFKDAARLQKVRFALFKLGVSGRVVAPEELSQPIGYLCDLEGFSPVEEPVEGGFSDEMLVLCGLSGPQLDALLSSLRRSRVVVALKAVVTEDNAAWSSLQLHDELCQEHEAMKGTRPKDAEKRSAHRK